MRHVLLALLLLGFCWLGAQTVNVSSYANQIRVLGSNNQAITLEATIGYFNQKAVNIDGQTWYNLNVSGAVNSFEAGAPALPRFNRNLAIGDDALMGIKVLEEEHVDLTLSVAPSRGLISRSVDPATVPYTFGQAYRENAFYPAENTAVSQAFIMRDVRGVTATVCPFVYNPATRTLRVYTRMVVELRNKGVDNVNVLTRHNATMDPSFKRLYQSQFLNYEQTESRYTHMTELGRLVVLCPQSFVSTIQPYVDWKRQKGMTVDLYVKETAGISSYTDLQNFSSAQYNSAAGLCYLQLVGDYAQMPSPMYTASYESGPSDPTYALVAGNDIYPDLFVGRFSAESVADLTTQVQRTIAYERDLTADATWLRQATAIASEYGGSGSGDDNESDATHQNGLRTLFLQNNRYTSVDQLYDTTSSAVQASQLSTVLNAGRGMVNYTGHGSQTSWGTTSFSNSNVAALTNDNKLPYIMAAACNNGEFNGSTCFAESWLRSTHNGNPVGAIATYMSSIGQDWDPPMQGQDEMAQLLVDDSFVTIGGLWYNSSCSVLEEYGTSNGGVKTFKTWHIFGDCSLYYRSYTPQTVVVEHMDNIIMGMGTFAVNTSEPNALVSLMFNNSVLASGTTDAAGDVTLDLGAGINELGNATLTVSGHNLQTVVQTVPVIAASVPYLVSTVLSINDNDDNVPNSNDTFSMHLNIGNVGAQAAGTTTLTLTTDSPYARVINGNATLTGVAAGGSTQLDAFSVHLSDSIPDQELVSFTLTMVSGAETWVNTVSIQVASPSVAVNSVSVSGGNGDDVADPGETISYTVRLANSGHQDLDGLQVILVNNDSRFSIANSQITVPTLAAQGIYNCVFSVTLDSSIPTGSVIPLGLVVRNDIYNAQFSLSQAVGRQMETFETGDLSAFSWVNGTPGWSVVNTAAHNGTYSLRSAAIGNSATTQITISSNCSTASAMSFWYKVSSESGYDFLYFYIDNVQTGAWSGEVAWTQFSTDITPGSHTFKWVYSKDYLSVGGSDCVWIDDVTFPIGGQYISSPILYSPDQTLDLGELANGSSHTVRLYNLGNAAFNGTATTNGSFSIVQRSGRLRNSINISIPADGYADATIVFTGDVPGRDYTGSLTLHSSDGAVSDYVMNITAVCNPDGVGENNNNLTNALAGCYPNPFNPNTNIHFSLAKTSDVKMGLYNVRGQKVRDVTSGTYTAGKHTIAFNGVDQSGRPLAGGVYFLRMQTNGFVSVKKMVLVK